MNLIDASYDISIHSTARVETIYFLPYRLFISQFQSTPPRGWRLSGYSLHRNSSRYFNPLHREGGDRKKALASVCWWIFQSTPPRGWRLKDSIKRQKVQEFQSTPPRGWRRRGFAYISSGNRISIHSTARVETSRDPLYILQSVYFNPFHREGGDGGPVAVRIIQSISIHSTARVETLYSSTFPLFFSRFQSTPPRGWRHMAMPAPSIADLFQSTPPRGWRLGLMVLTCSCLGFQSTPPRGWRPSPFLLHPQHFQISIHSTARVETAVNHILCACSHNFNPLHREGGDRQPNLLLRH